MKCTCAWYYSSWYLSSYHGPTQAMLHCSNVSLEPIVFTVIFPAFLAGVVYFSLKYSIILWFFLNYIEVNLTAWKLVKPGFWHCSDADRDVFTIILISMFGRSGSTWSHRGPIDCRLGCRYYAKRTWKHRVLEACATKCMWKRWFLCREVARASLLFANACR